LFNGYNFSFPGVKAAGTFTIHFLLVTRGAELFLRSHQFCRYSRTSQHFMEPDCSLPCS
jgi:hypothetical protein